MSIIDQADSLPGARQPPAFFARRVQSARRYYLDLAPSRASRMVVVCGGREECGPDYSVRRAEFPYQVLEWIVAGRGRVRMEGRWQDLCEGVLFAYGPGVEHEIESDSERPLVKHFVAFTGKEAVRSLEAARVAPGTITESRRSAELLWLFEAMLRDGLQGGTDGEHLCTTLLQYLLGMLAASPCERVAVGARKSFERYDSYLVEHAMDLRSLAEFATACGVTAEYLCRLYKRFTGQTPYPRLLRLRMCAVADRLASDNRSIREVAAEMGWDDPFLMSRQFKRVFGVSPRTFRQLGSCTDCADSKRIP